MSAPCKRRWWQPSASWRLSVSSWRTPSAVASWRQWCRTPETVQVAERYAGKHRERSAVLERKLVVQREELALAEREVAEMTAEAQRATAGQPSETIAAAWRDLESAGATRPDEHDRTQAETDRQRRESAIEAQSAYLKRKLGKQ